MYGIMVILWRFFTGAHLDGKERTNATWFQHGTMPKHRARYFWNRIPRAHRAGYRMIMFLSLVTETYLILFQRGLFEILNGALLLYASEKGIKALIRLRGNLRQSVRVTAPSLNELPQELLSAYGMDDIVVPVEDGEMTDAKVRQLRREAK
jgi:hypothetical protein